MLTGFDIWVDRQPGVTQPLLYDIRTTPAGAPSDPDSGGNILASGSLPAIVFDTGPGSTFQPLPSGLPHVDLGSGIPVTVGEILAIVLRSDDPGIHNGLTYNWHGTSPGGYLGGSAFLRTNGTWQLQVYDQIFRSYVVAEPSAGAL